MRSLDWLWTPLRYWWLGAVPVDRAARRSIEGEAPTIRARIDTGRLVRVGLVRHHGLSPWGMTQSHQVVAYGYGVEDDTVAFSIYDPNWPARDDVTVTVGPSGLAQSTGEIPLSLFRIG